jgi:large subunit ribosomal protein L10
LSLNLENKKAVVAEVKSSITGAETMVIAEYSGVTVESLTSVRRKARKEDVYLHVVKNTLAKRAVQGTSFEALADKMSGQLIYSASKDPVAAAKILNDFSKENQAVKIVAGVYNGELLDVAGIKKLASIPSKPELLAMVLGTMLQVPAGFARVVAAIKEKKESAA